MIYYEKNLTEYKNLTNKQLIEFYKNGDQEARVVLSKRNLRVNGDVYFYKGMICNLKNHNLKFKDNVKTIEEAFLNFKKTLKE